MQYRNLGAAGPRVSVIGLGCLGVTGGYGPADPDECLATIRYGLDRGVALLDVADFYGDGAVEELVGRAVAGRGDDIVVATRGGVRVPAPGRPPTVVDGRPAYLRAAVHASLARLGAERIGLYTLGRVDPQVPLGESIGALAELVAEGKIAHLGLSEVSAAQLRAAHAVHPIAAVQSEYSWWERGVERDVLPAAAELGVGFVAHTPLGKGLLTGSLRDAGQLGPRDYRRNHPRFTGTHFDENRDLVDRAHRALADLGVPPAQLALAWLVARGAVPVPGTRRRDHLASNLAAADLSLTPQQLDRLTTALPAGAVSGAREPVRR